MTYYYYVTPQQLATIETEGKIRAGSTAQGPGVFFTSAGPEDTKPSPLEVLKQIHGEDTPALNKWTEYLAFNKSDISVKRKKKGIFFQLGNLELKDVKYTKGHVDH